MQIQNSRIKIKTSNVSGIVPSIAPSDNHTDGTWNNTNIYKGELFINTEDEKVWYRSEYGIIELAAGGGPTPITDFVSAALGGTFSNDIAIVGELEVSQNIVVDGDVTATAFYGDGSNLTGIIVTWNGGTVQNPTIFEGPVDFEDIVKLNVLQALIGTEITINSDLVVNGTVTADFLVGDGSGLTNLPSAVNYFTESVDLTGTLLRFSRNDLANAYEIDLAPIGNAGGVASTSWDGLTNSLIITLLDATIITQVIDTFNGLVVSGTLTADHFVGDGSGLTNLTSVLSTVDFGDITGIVEDNTTLVDYIADQITTNTVYEESTGNDSTVRIGVGSTAIGNYSASLGGQNNLVSGNYSVVSGGLGNTASGDNSGILGGTTNTVSHADSFIIGSNITSNATNTTFVEKLNIKDTPTIDNSNNKLLAWNSATGSIEQREAATVSNGIYIVSTGTLSSVRNGVGNTAVGNYSASLGGQNNLATGPYSSIVGGFNNQASGFMATLSGGYQNRANNTSAVVSGGNFNRALGVESTIGGGKGNTASATSSTVAGGVDNTASGTASTIGGGSFNKASGLCSSIVGGYQNSAIGDHSFIGSGFINQASGACSIVVGGRINAAQGLHSFVGSGRGNTASGDYSFIGAGNNNSASGYFNTIGGGWLNTASGEYSTISGGYCNTVNKGSFIGGGFNSTASGYYSTIGGGIQNSASAIYSHVGGGYENRITASAYYGTISGGYGNTATGEFSSISGGYKNRVFGINSVISGGRNNFANAINSGILGGTDNTVSHADSFIIGSNITSNATNTTFVEKLNIKDTPTIDNANNKLLVWNDSTGSIEQREATSLVSGVSGPVSSTDNAIVRWDGITGEVIQNSSVIVSDTDSITGAVDITLSGSLIHDSQFDTYLRPRDFAIDSYVNGGRVSLHSYASNSLTGAFATNPDGLDIDSNFGVDNDSLFAYVDASDRYFKIGTGTWNAGPNTAWLSISSNETNKAHLTLYPNTGVNKTTGKVDGDIWYNGTNLYFYNGTNDIDIIGPAVIADGSITTAKLADGAVTTIKIADLNVTADKLATNSVTTPKIANLNVTVDKLADNSVSSNKIINLAVTQGKIANDAVGNTKLANMPPQTFKGRDGNVSGDPKDLQIFEVKRMLIDTRVDAIGSIATLTPNMDDYDAVEITSQTQALTIAAPTGALMGLNRQRKLIIRIKDNGTPQTIAYNAVFRAIGVTLPVTTVASKLLYLGFIFNFTDTRWDCVAVAQEA